MASSDTELVQQCLRGRQDAMTRLVEQFQADVFSLCVRMLGNRHDAEDVAQEVFLRIFRSLRRWDPSRPLKPWIVTITVNRCRTYLTQRGKRPDVVAFVDDEVAAGVADDGNELQKEIQAAVSDLRPEFRTAFAMFHEQGLGYDFIADALERPVGTVKTWLHRARQQVLERLRERGIVPEVSHDVQ